MKKIVIYLDKYSDWLETYSFFKNDYEIISINIYMLDNERNDPDSIKHVYSEFINFEITHFNINIFNNSTDLQTELTKVAKNLNAADVLIAPFVRYRHIWALTKVVAHNVKTIHISECIPDTFGHILYRLAFRGKHLSSWLTLPLAKVYAMTHKPDVCFFPFYPEIKNSFVKQTKEVLIPKITDYKFNFLNNICGADKRPLLISGFGFEYVSMAKSLNLTKYIATSKYKEIIIDGKIYPLEYRICAEEVVILNLVSTIIGYNSSAMVWSKKIDKEISINCYKSSMLEKTFGKLYSNMSDIALKKIGIELLDEPKGFFKK